MKPFYNIRKGRASTTSEKQSLANVLPMWTKARSEPWSNWQNLVSDYAPMLNDASLNASLSGADLTASTANLFFSGDIYVSKIDPAFIFEFRDIKGEVNYTTPTVTGTLGLNSFVLKEALERNVGTLFTDPPFKAGTPVPFSLKKEMGGAPAPIEFFSVEGEVIFRVTEYNFAHFFVNSPYFDDGDLIESDGPFLELTGLGYSVPRIHIESLRYPDIKHEIPVQSVGFYRTQHCLAPGFYRVNLESFPGGVQVLCSVNGFNFDFILNTYQSYHSQVESSPMYLEIDLEDPSYINVLTELRGGLDAVNATDGLDRYQTVERQRFLGSDGEPYEIASIAKPEHSPLLFTLDAEVDNTIRVHDIYLGQVESLLESPRVEAFTLYWMDVPVGIGETLELETRRVNSYLLDRYHAVRMRVTHTYDGVRDTFFINQAGDKVSAPEAEIGPDRVYNVDTEYRWSFPLEVLGTLEFTVEIKFEASSDDWLIVDSVLVLSGYKQCHSEFQVDLGGDTLEKIWFNGDGDLIGKTAGGDLYKIPLLYNTFAINFESYELYTLTKFDDIELEYI